MLPGASGVAESDDVGVLQARVRELEVEVGAVEVWVCKGGGSQGGFRACFVWS